MNQNTIVLLIIVLVPLVPAFFLFRFLKSRAAASGKATVNIGPFKDIQVDVSGSFAGYVITLVAMFLIFQQVSKPAHQVWTVEGKISYEFSNQTLTLKDIKPSIIPETFQVAENGFFQMKIVVPRSEKGTLMFPQLQFGHEGFGSETVLLEKKEIETLKNYEVLLNSDEQIITVRKPIVLKSKSK